jgi:hypothetical protein
VVEVVTVDYKRLNQSNIPPNSIRVIPSVLLWVRSSSAKAASLATTKTSLLGRSLRLLVILNTGDGLVVPLYSNTRYLMSSRYSTQR